MKLFAKYFPFYIAAVLTSGCAGTAMTRAPSPHVGAYPYCAVSYDCRYSINKPTMIPVFIICLPFDLVFDTALFPFDLGFWAFGVKKHDYEYSRGNSHGP
jgi:uncharacterized protein YceK